MKAPALRPGDVFDRLTVIEVWPDDRRGKSRVLVRCVCGREIVVYRTNLHAGRTRSCGCARRELMVATRAGGQPRAILSHTPEYRSWRCAKNRTTNPASAGWRYYGARGITMAAAWLEDFAAFLAHVGPRPGPGYSIDRIDNDGNYEPGNVRWATALEQRHNQRPRRQVAS